MPGQPVVLDTLGGLVSTARPEDIPEGASPRTYDTDFIVGRVIQRAGLQNVYSYEGTTFGPNGGGTASDISTEGNAWSTPTNILADDGTYTTSATVSPLTTDTLQVTNFNLTVPSIAAVAGIAVDVSGFAPSATLYVQMLKAGVAVGEIKEIALPTSYGTVSLGGTSILWDEAWLYSDVDATGFGVNLWAVSSSIQTVALDYCSITIYGTESATNYNGIVDANINSTDQVTLALDATGLVWEEDVTNNPGVFSRASLIPSVIPGSYMKGLDANGIAYMAYSNLTAGTSQPMQYNGQWCDRITQVGPGASPFFTPQQASADTFAISTIIPQATQQSRGSSYFLQSSGPGSTTAGSVVTIYYSDSTLAGPDTDLVNAVNSGYAVYLWVKFDDPYDEGASFPYTVVQVTSASEGQPPGQPRNFYYFTFNVPTSGYSYIKAAGFPDDTVTYQRTLVNLTTSVPVPGLTPGNAVTITGASVSSYNNVWQITQALNSATMNITETAVSDGVATYTYVLTGTSTTAPAVGQLVTITNTTNADGALNLTNVSIASATGGSSGSFTVLVSGIANFATVSESGQATTAGTIFCFDPGAALVGTSTDPIYGDSTGGSLTFSAAPEAFVTQGVKQGTIFWITRNGAVTAPAPPVTFTIPANTQSIVATLIPQGPPNVDFIGFSFTESGQNETKGASFYTYDTSANFTVSGIQYTASALIVPNGTTTATFSFPDSVLLTSDEIDIQGNNYFNLIEIGSPVWIAQYANRMRYGLCQNKVQNFLNLSFDGGYLLGASPLPLGWTSVGAIANTMIGLVVSPDFGNTLQILNTGGSTITDTIILYQSAYQDYNLVNILQPNTAYSVRLKGRSLNADAQQVTISLLPYASGSFAAPLGSMTFTLNQGDFTIETAEIMAAQATIPATLQLAIEIASLSAGAAIQIDRIELFPTLNPVSTTTTYESYAGNFEAVDGVTGQLGCGDDNPQATQGSFQLLEQMYTLKTASMCVTQDSPNYEPNQWDVPLASQGVGAVGPNAFHAEEEFAITVSRSGVFLFDGGKPMPISRELQSTGVNGSIWEKINWAAGSTIWCRFSTDKRQLYIGIPMITPNFWLPNAAASTPTSPNVILMCNFTGCPTAGELGDSTPVHTTMFGDLKALDMRRKWSLWQIACPVAEFVTRQDGLSSPLFLCNGISSSKIYQLVDGAASRGQNTDDGAAINWLYTTYGFTKAKQGQQMPSLGALRKVWYYFAATMEGIGQVARKFYSNTLGALSQNIYTAPPATLSYPAQNDQECVLEIGGQRLFVEFSAVGSGGYAEIGPIILDGEMDKNSPHRGVSS